jgi:hypothetical protein
MKLSAITLFAVVWGTCLAAAAPLPCNQQLMESFELDGQRATVRDENLICPDVTDNCCTYATQVNIFKKWIVAGERERIKDIYQEFADIFDKIFEDFTQVEHLAKEVEEETEGIVGSNCNKIASAIAKYKVSNLRNNIRDVIGRAQKFLLTSREGFYCSLCDATNHRFFNLTRQEYHLSFGFCSKMVENTLNYYLFKYKFFVKVSRLYSEFLMKCDLHGKYHRNNFLKNDVKFFKRDQIVGEIESCKRGFNKPGSMLACQDFCSRFNPVKFDEYLEGELDKLFMLHGFFEKRMHWLKERKTRQVAAENEGKTKLNRRVLQENGAKAKATEANEITNFNKEFRTSLVRPIPYSFKDDLSLSHSLHYEESIIKPSQEVVFNLLEFEGEVKQLGIDFFHEGSSSFIDRNTAERVFELLNPDLKEGKDLEGYLHK